MNWFLLIPAVAGVVMLFIDPASFVVMILYFPAFAAAAWLMEKVFGTRNRKKIE